ncbi:hypothetical protein AVEN_252187-1 [Araneus ventricosus]|uniref:Uncharacterized protein n=1 Tax=Araneus ventricosus TaxID=182803 RepID=A0A4Y2NC53_ARAVE|nr:hypothetical protein AVEN_27132-2 [Araneus ventricosus]GBN36284.1 hypothetical protein AVEN_252187-1 [Araneus ventricosus]
MSSYKPKLDPLFVGVEWKFGEWRDNSFVLVIDQHSKLRESCVYVFGGVSSQGWSAVAKNEMVVLNDISLHGCSSLPLPLTGLAAVCVPPVSPSLRAESIAMLLHAQLTFH